MLYGIADIPQCYSRPNQTNPCPHAFVGDLYQAPGTYRGLFQHEHHAGIAVIAVFYNRDIDINNIGCLEYPVTGDAMADNVVHRGADGFREALIVERGRDTMLDIDDVIMTDLVQ